MEGWIAIVGPLMGVVLGGAITWLLGKEQRIHEVNKEKREILLSKYEELHDLLGVLHSCIGEMVIQIVSEAAYNRKFDPKSIKTKMPIERISMLIDFYVPELKSDYGYIDKQVKFLTEHVAKHIMEEQRTEKFLAESAVTSNELSKVTSKTIAAMKAKLAERASSLLENA